MEPTVETNVVLATDVVVPATDLVGYGKHMETTYQDLWDTEPGYCLWTINKFDELVKLGDELTTPYAAGDSKMKRLAYWLAKTEELLEAQGPAMEYNDDMELVPKAGCSATLASRAAKILAEGSEKFYAVAYPDACVYTSWNECKPHVVGVKGVIYKSFPSREEAEEYVRNPPARKVAAKKRLRESGANDTADAGGKQSKKKKKAKAADGEEDSVGAEGSPKKDANDTPKKKKKAAKSLDQNKEDNASPSPKKEVNDKAKRQKAVKKSIMKAAAKKALDGPDKVKKEPKVSLAKAQKAKSPVTGDGAATPEQGETKPTKSVKAAAKVKDEKEAKVEKAAPKPRKSTASSEPSSKKLKEVSKDVQSDATTAARKTDAEGSTISADVLKRAEDLGMISSLRNLAARAEIMSLGLTPQNILDALMKADGLVNKAKNALLATDPSTPEKCSSVDASRVTPEKQEEVKDASKMCSTDLRVAAKEVSSAPKELTAMQRARIELNRELALARRVQAAA